MPSYSKVILIGHLGGEPEMRFTPSGKAVTNFSLAVNRSYKRNDEWVDETDWFRVNAWERLAERCNESLGKGDAVLVEGQIQIRKWQTNEGVEKTSVDVLAQRVLFIKGKKDLERKEPSQTAEVALPEETTPESELLPF